MEQLRESKIRTEPVFDNGKLIGHRLIERLIVQTPNPQIPPNPIQVEVKTAPDPVKPGEHAIAQPDPDVHQVPEEPED